MRRKRAEWQQPLDDEILELLADTDIVLTPSIIAFNIDRSREGVAHRILVLEKYGMVEKVERGKYRISDIGEGYLKGDLDASTLEK